MNMVLIFRLCKEPNHVPLRCDEVEKQGETSMRTYIEARLTEAMIRRCHRCQKAFVKEFGCNKMTCTCGATSCYVCRAKDIDYDHFGNAEQVLIFSILNYEYSTDLMKVKLKRYNSICMYILQPNQFHPKFDLCQNKLFDLHLIWLLVHFTYKEMDSQRYFYEIEQLFNGCFCKILAVTRVT